VNKTIPLIAAGAGGALAGYLLHDEVKKDIDYGSYLLPHKYYVFKASRELDLPLTRALGHDLSKFKPDEWVPYSDWFNGPAGITGTKDRETYLNWRKAVDKHYIRNEHHWRPKHLEPNQVPLDVKLESIADWYGVNRAKGNTKKDFKDWFEEKRHTFPIDKPTVDEAQRRLFKTGSVDPFMHAYSAIMTKGVGKNLPLVSTFGAKEYRKVMDQRSLLGKIVTPNINIQDTLIRDAERMQKLNAKKENKYTSLEYIVASGDPMVRAITRGLPPNQQRSIWRRYAQVVLRNRNYGRKNKVAGDYIKTKERE
jgi:hypothetical protein